MDLNVGKYTTTQEMFLAKVGITNSYQENNLNLCQPFFVSVICLTLTVSQEIQGVQFVYIKKNQLYFVFTSKKREMMTAFMLELLIKVTNVSNCHGHSEFLT